MKELFIRIKEKINFKENKLRHGIGLVLFLAQVIATVVAVWYLNKLDILPPKYYNLLMVVLVLCLLLTVVLNLTKKLHILGKLFCLIICAGLVAVCYYEHHAVVMLNSITTQNYDVDTYVLVTLKESSITNSAGLKGKKLGVADKMNNEQSVNKAIEQLKNNANTTDIKVQSYAGISQMVSGLFKGEVDALLYNASLNDIIYEIIDYYESSTKTIVQFEVKTIIEEQQPTQEATQKPSQAPEQESQTQGPTEPQTENDDIKIPVYDPARDPNAPGGGGYIGGDNTVDNSKKGPITDRAFSIYVSGIDAYGSLSGRSRSDVNIIITVNPKTKEIVLTSTPRDYYVPIPGVTYGNWRDKLTHAGVYGVWTSVATLENVYETNIDYYVRVNFTSFMKIVEVLGGIDVYSAYDFNAFHGGYHFNKGMNRITSGAQALGFARERYAFPDGDRQRGRNHMAIIEAMMKKAMSPAILTNFADLVNAVSNSVQTNMTMEEITALAKMQINDGASWTIVQQSADGAGAGRECFSYTGAELSVILPNQSTINACKAKIQDVLNK